MQIILDGSEPVLPTRATNECQGRHEAPRNSEDPAMTAKMIIATALSSLILCTGLSVGASAKPMYFKSNYSHGVGYGGIVLGSLALGALAAGAAAAAEGDCYLDSRRVIDKYGTIYVRPVRVCE